MLNVRIIHYCLANSKKQLQTHTENSQNQKLLDVQKLSYGTFNDIVEERRLIRKQDKQNTERNLPGELRMRQMKQRQCNVKLFMNHNDWKSQYIYAIMNYQKLGFTPISNYTRLRDASFFYKVSKKPLPEQFPIMRFAKPITSPNVLHGIKQIIKFLNENQLIRYQVQNDEIINSTMKTFIDQNIVRNLQAVFWHPSLTFFSLFHSHMASYKYSSQNYDIIPMLYINAKKFMINIPKNLIKIIRNKNLYYESKNNLQKSLKQIIVILNNQQYLGGSKPSHLDFYLFAVLNTKINVKYFQQFLRNSIGIQFWMWMIRMRSTTQYDKERMTII